MAGEGDGGVPSGQLLGEYSELANTYISTPPSAAEVAYLADLRHRLHPLVGQTGVVEAAATVAIFNGLVRAADGTGIQLDERVFAVSSEFRDRLGVDGYGGAVNSTSSESATAQWDELSMDGLFGD